MEILKLPEASVETIAVERSQFLPLRTMLSTRKFTAKRVDYFPGIVKFSNLVIKVTKFNGLAFNLGSRYIFYYLDKIYQVLLVQSEGDIFTFAVAFFEKQESSFTTTARLELVKESPKKFLLPPQNLYA